MTETKFTPGPWTGKVDGVYHPSDWEAHHDSAKTYEYAPVVDERGSTVCLVVGEPASFVEGSTPLDYNAHLIAAAPDLYEALEELCDWYGWHTGMTAIAANAALAKARGEE